MAYSAVPNVATGNLWTAANNNTYLRENLLASWVGTTAGDVDYYLTAATKSRLAGGTSGELQRVDAGETAPAWGGLLNALISDATPRAIADSTFTEVTLTVEDVDIDGFVANPVANTITIPANFDGSYLMNYRVEYASNAVGFREIRLLVDGAPKTYTVVRIPAINGDTTISYGTFIRNQGAGDLITLETWQNSGGALNVIKASLGIARVL